MPFLDVEPEMPRYVSPEPGAKIIKIKPIDKELWFDGTNLPIDKFISRYEKVGRIDGAAPMDLANQIINFMKGLDLYLGPRSEG